MQPPEEVIVLFWLQAAAAQQTLEYDEHVADLHRQHAGVLQELHLQHAEEVQRLVREQVGAGMPLKSGRLGTAGHI